MLENGDGADDAIYAYDLESGERVEEREFELDETQPRAPRRLVRRHSPLGLRQRPGTSSSRYDLESGERLAERDIALAEAQRRRARHLVRRRVTMWVLDGRQGRALRLRPGERRVARRVRPRRSQQRPARHLVRRQSRSGSPTTAPSASSPTGCPCCPGRRPKPRTGEASEEAAQTGAQPLERVRDEEFDKLSQRQQ